jgi:ketosteroid isomerase-like protein
MTTADRLRSVTCAVRATLEGDSTIVDELFAPDVHASMTTSVWSATGLAVEIEDRAGAFEDVDLHVTHWHAPGDELWVEWTAAVFHAGALAIKDAVIPPTGRRTELHGITVAEFTADRIAGFRQYWDATTLLEPDASRRPHGGRRQRG